MRIRWREPPSESDNDMLDADSAEFRLGDLSAMDRGDEGGPDTADFLDEPDDECAEAISGSVSGSESEIFDEEKYNENALLPPIEALDPVDDFFVKRSLSLLQYPKKSLNTLSSLSSLINAGTSS